MILSDLFEGDEGVDRLYYLTDKHINIFYIMYYYVYYNAYLMTFINRYLNYISRTADKLNTNIKHNNCFLYMWFFFGIFFFVCYTNCFILSWIYMYVHVDNRVICIQMRGFEIFQEAVVKRCISYRYISSLNHKHTNKLYVSSCVYKWYYIY